MELETQNIIELHKIDRRLVQIKEEKGDLPKIVSDKENTILNLNESIEESNGKSKNLLQEVSDYKISIKQHEDLLEKYNKQIFQVKNNKEYDALLKEIDHIKNQNNELVGNVQNLNEEIGQCDDFKKESLEKINLIQEELKINRQELEDASIETASEEKLLKNKKNDVLSKIKDKIFLKKYNNDDYEFGLSTISRGSCNNCFSSLPDQILIDIKDGGKLFPCPDCGIFLYHDQNEDN